MQKIDREYLRDCSTRSSQTPDNALSLQTAPAVLLPPHEKPVVRGSGAGLSCAEGAGRALAAPDVVFCSPLTRAIQTSLVMFEGTGVSANDSADFAH